VDSTFLVHQVYHFFPDARGLKMPPAAAGSRIWTASAFAPLRAGFLLIPIRVMGSVWVSLGIGEKLACEEGAPGAFRDFGGRWIWGG
jgi:hypothetical protein